MFERLVSETKLPARSISIAAPALVKEWHPIKNGKLKPEHFSFGSQQKAWWVCKEKHEWEAVIATRVKGHGCPHCYSISRKRHS
jgi:hypothetical protein